MSPSGHDEIEKEEEEDAAMTTEPDEGEEEEESSSSDSSDDSSDDSSSSSSDSSDDDKKKKKKQKKVSTKTKKKTPTPAAKKKTPTSSEKPSAKETPSPRGIAAAIMRGTKTKKVLSLSEAAASAAATTAEADAAAPGNFKSEATSTDASEEAPFDPEKTPQIPNACFVVHVGDKTVRAVALSSGPYLDRMPVKYQTRALLAKNPEDLLLIFPNDLADIMDLPPGSGSVISTTKSVRTARATVRANMRPAGNMVVSPLAAIDGLREKAAARAKITHVPQEINEAALATFLAAMNSPDCVDNILPDQMKKYGVAPVKRGSPRSAQEDGGDDDGASAAARAPSSKANGAASGGKRKAVASDKGRAPPPKAARTLAPLDLTLRDALIEPIAEAVAARILAAMRAERLLTSD